jgi:hypothetical protein
MQSEVGVFCLVVDFYLERVMHLIILPYIQSRSQGKELKMCLNGWRKNCQFDYHFVVIGEFDESLRTEFHWVEFIHCPTIEKKDSQYNPHLDIQHKMELAMERFGDKYDGFIRMADDIYAIKPFELEDITTVHYHSSEFIGKKDSPPSYWSHDKWKTRQLLDKDNLPHINYTTHYPYWYEFSKLSEIWNKFNMREESYVLEDVYFNYYSHSEPILDIEARLAVLDANTYEKVLCNAENKPNIKFICNSNNGWSKGLENELKIITTNK